MLYQVVWVQKLLKALFSIASAIVQLRGNSKLSSSNVSLYRSPHNSSLKFSKQFQFVLESK